MPVTYLRALALAALVHARVTAADALGWLAAAALVTAARLAPPELDPVIGGAAAPVRIGDLWARQGYVYEATEYREGRWTLCHGAHYRRATTEDLDAPPWERLSPGVTSTAARGVA